MPRSSSSESRSSSPVMLTNALSKSSPGSTRLSSASFTR